MRTAVVLAAFAVVAATTAGAVEIWATDILGETNSGTVGDQLIKFNSTTPGSVTPIGSTGVANTLMAGLDFVGGTLYAYAQSGAVGLYTIDRDTGAATFVGSGGLQPGDQISDLSYNPATGKMYGVGVGGAVESSIRIYAINLATGQATLEKTVSAPSGKSVLVNGLASGADGTQYVLDLNNNCAARVDGTILTLLGAEGFNSNYDQGLTIDWAGDATLYHGAWNNDVFDTNTRLYTINKISGAAGYLGAIGPLHMGQSKYAIGDIAIIPEPATLSVLLLGVLALRRR